MWLDVPATLVTENNDYRDPHLMVIRRTSRVLIVEDSDSERELLCEILREEGLEAIGCGSAKAGLELVDTQDFGLAVVDLRLPDLSGTQLLDRIHQLDEDLRVIIYTGAASYDSVKEAINLGAFAYVEKLSDPSELLRHVHRACHEQVNRYAADLESAVAERTEELARSNRELGDFASIVAHDLRTPLLTISGYSQILREKNQASLDTESTEYLGHIVEAVNRMNRLIEDLLDYSHVGRAEDPFQDVELDGVLTQAEANLKAAVQQSGAKIVRGPLPTVPGNATQLLQLFQNLLGNAIKFHGDEAPRIRIEATQKDESWQFAVEDNGIGIEPNNRDRVFQVFQQVHGKDYAGTGIGLAICKKIVERHRGTIWLESTPGKGSTFFFTLPSQSQAQ